TAVAHGPGDCGHAAEVGDIAERTGAAARRYNRSKMTTENLEARIERWFAAGAEAIGNQAALAAFLELREALEAGTLRSAEPDADAPTGWRVNAWVKRGILLGFRIGTLMDMSVVGYEERGHPWSATRQVTFVDKGTYPARRFKPEDGVRIVPGGS